MAFSDLPYSAREKSLGDQSEGKFETWAEKNDVQFERYGFDHPCFRYFPSIPAFIRFTPDYIAEGKKNKKFLVECKGCGGRILKIKHDSINYLEEWNAHLTVWFFIYNSKENAYALINYRQMVDLCNESPTKRFSSDNKAYYEIRTKNLKWTPMEDENDKQNNE